MVYDCLKGIQNKSRFVGSVFVKLENVENTALIDFVEKLFDEENISFNVKGNYYNTTTTILLKNYDMPLKEDISEMLNKCVVLNTYLGSYFKEKDITFLHKPYLLKLISLNFSLT